jgi:hypothetical protein
MLCKACWGVSRGTGLSRAASTALLVVGLSACGGSPFNSRSQSQAIAPVYGLAVLNDGLDDGSAMQRLSLAVSGQKGRLFADISVEGAVNLKALYFSLLYDPAKLTPVSVTSSGRLEHDRTNQLLEMADFSYRGRLQHGQILVRPQDRAGFTGSGVLARVEFARLPESVRKRISLAPRTSAPLLEYAPGSSSVRIWQFNKGDYDQNGEVAISDLTPLGQHFGESAPLLDPTSAIAIIDGDNNGEINIADLTAIGQNLGSTVEGYNLYVSANLSDYPTDWQNGPNGPGAAVAGTALVGPIVQSGFRNRYDLFTPSMGYYWARSFHGSDLGASSSVLDLTVP